MKRTKQKDMTIVSEAQSGISTQGKKSESAQPPHREKPIADPSNK